MDIGEKADIVRAMAKGAEVLEDNVVAAYLKMAERAIINRVYPFGGQPDSLPARYDFAQIRISVYNINKRGAEGESKHIEVGTERDYSSADIPDDLLSELVPMVGVPV